MIRRAFVVGLVWVSSWFAARASASAWRCEGCEPGIVLLEWNGASCLGALVSPDELVTAGHCVVGRTEGAFVVRLPAVGAHPEELAEARVISASFDLAAGSDFARLRLSAPTRRQPFVVRTEALSNGTMVRHWRRSRVGDVQVLYAETCEVVIGSFVLPRADSPDSARLVLGGCGVRPGDSGGPVTLDGELVALNQAWLFDVDEPPRRIGLGYDARWRTEPPVITAINLRCAMGGRCRWRAAAEAREAWVQHARGRVLVEESAVLDALSRWSEAHPDLYVRVVRKARGSRERIRLGPVCSDEVPRRVALPAFELVRTLDAFGRLVVEHRTMPNVLRRFAAC